MTQNYSTQNGGEQGYLTVRVSTAGGAIPLSGAAVNIRGGDVDDSSIIYALVTDRDGLTPTVALDAPPRSASQTPQTTAPAYAVYNVDVYAEGYVPAFFNNVPIFSGINSVQPAVLLPFIENETTERSVNVTETGNADIEGEIYDR